MQPPPRKGKHSGVDLGSIHKKQLTKLQQKNQHEENLLDDIRLFSKQRSVIEKEYAQALCKLAQQFFSKRSFPLPNEDDQQKYKPIMLVWKTVLDETDRVGKIRLQAADTYFQQISETAKPLKSAKAQVAKRVFDQINVLQKEVALSVHDMHAAKKIYCTEEHLTHDASVKATDADNKVKNKSTGIFTSLATLQQKSAKLNTKLETCEIKSTAARNEYLLQLAASNAHLSRYYNTDLTELIKMLDGDMFESVKEFFMTLSKTELECCGITQECFMKILADSTMISREYDLQCFLQDNVVYTDTVQYKFEPQDNDTISKVNPDHGAEVILDKDAKKCATKIAKENRTLRENTRLLQALEEQTADNLIKSADETKDGSQAPSSPVDPEIKKDELRQNIRKAETGKLKAEAKVEAMREGGVNVDKWLNSAMAEALAEQEMEEEVAAKATTGSKKDHRSSTSVSMRSESSAGSRSRTQSTNEQTEHESESVSTYPVNSTSVSSAPNDSTYLSYQEEDDYGADETFVDGHHGSASTGYSSGRSYPCYALALYDFQGSNADELNIKENEQIELLSDGDGDGWVKGRNTAGEIGFIPENYLQVDQSNGAVDENEMNVDRELPADSVGNSSTPEAWGSAPTSAGYDSEPVSAGYDSAPPSGGYDTSGYESTPQGTGYNATAYNENEQSGGVSEGARRISAYSSTDYEVQQATVPTEQPTEGLWARALYDYDATCEEEVSFQEGQFIRITRKDENGIDDGWWEGEINGKSGVFPSMVVEELDFDPHPNIGDLASPDRPGPPAFTPPEPGPPPPSLEVTQPTPSDEGAPPLASHLNGEAEPNREEDKEKKEEASADKTEGSPTETSPQMADDMAEASGQEQVVTAEIHVDSVEDNKLDSSNTDQINGQNTQCIKTVNKAENDMANNGAEADDSVTKCNKQETVSSPPNAAINLDDIEFADDDNTESVI